MMEAIKDTIVAVFKELDSRQAGSASRDPAEIIKKVLTKKELEHIKCNYFRKGILFLHVDSSSWLYSLTMRRQAVLTDLQQMLPEVKEIRFRIGDIT